MDKINFSKSHNELCCILSDTIMDIYGYKVSDYAANLYRSPYNMKAYDIVYILFAVFDKLGFVDGHIDNCKLDNTLLHTINGLANFLSSI